MPAFRNDSLGPIQAGLIEGFLVVTQKPGFLRNLWNGFLFTRIPLASSGEDTNGSSLTWTSGFLSDSMLAFRFLQFPCTSTQYVFQSPLLTSLLLLHYASPCYSSTTPPCSLGNGKVFLPTPTISLLVKTAWPCPACFFSSLLLTLPNVLGYFLFFF